MQPEVCAEGPEKAGGSGAAQRGDEAKWQDRVTGRGDDASGRDTCQGRRVATTSSHDSPRGGRKQEERKE